MTIVLRNIYFPKLYDSFSQDLKDYLIELERRLQRDILRPEGNSSSPTVIATEVRRAKIQSIGSSTYTCKLFDKDGNASGDDITVTPFKHLGSNSLSGNVWPDYAVDDAIVVMKDKNGSWYTTFPVDDTYECP